MPSPDHEKDPFALGSRLLPIVTPDPPRASGRSETEKYGSLFYLGAAGLAILIALVSWFGWQAWALRDVWASVYVLHDSSRSDADRIGAAYALSRDPRVNQRQLWDIACCGGNLPPLARYMIAESLTAEAASADPRGYGVAVARSEGWPVWLRLLMVRPMAYATALDLPVNRESLKTLCMNPDRATALWATYALAEGPDGDAASADALRRAASTDTPERALAVDLASALDETRFKARLSALDAATLQLRTLQPDAARLWEGWKVADGRLVPATAMPDR